VGTASISTCLQQWCLSPLFLAPHLPHYRAPTTATTTTGGEAGLASGEALLSSMPVDVATDPLSKAAAEAARARALRLTGGNQHAAGLMMAWFYAGYGAANAAAARDCGGASGGGS